MHLALGTINLNFSIIICMEWRQKRSKETTANVTISVEVQGHLEHLCISQMEKSCNVSSKALSCGLAPCMCTPSLGWTALRMGKSGLAILPYKNTPVHIFATGYTNSRWKHFCATKIFLPAGRQVAERLTLQGSPKIFFFLRCFMLSGAVWGKGWKNNIGWVF